MDASTCDSRNEARWQLCWLEEINFKVLWAEKLRALHGAVKHTHANRLCAAFIMERELASFELTEQEFTKLNDAFSLLGEPFPYPILQSLPKHARKGKCLIYDENTPCNKVRCIYDLLCTGTKKIELIAFTVRTAKSSLPSRCLPCIPLEGPR